MEPRQYEGCGFGPCRNSIERGGAGCHLCDVIAKLPQPKFKSATQDLRKGDKQFLGSERPKKKRGRAR